MNRARLLCVCLVLGGSAACGREGFETRLPDAAFPDGSVAFDAGPEPEVGYRVRGSWLLRGIAPTAASCDTDGISLVRLQVLDEEARVLDELLAPCEHGSFEGSTTLAWGVRRYGEWVALGEDGERQRQPVPTARPTALRPAAPSASSG